MFQRYEPAYGGIGGGAGSARFGSGHALALDRPMGVPTFGRATPVKIRRSLRIEALTDLGVDIGSAPWWRGLAACTTLCALTVALSPSMKPLPASPLAAMPPSAFEEQRALSIAPLAWGADTGRRMAATDAVRPLTNVPERPQVELMAALGQGDSLRAALQRAGVGAAEATRVEAMTAQTVDAETIPAGTQLAIVLGRRASRSEARPLQSLDFRARLDMKLAFVRTGGALTMQALPIAVDRTPLRIEGQIGDSLYDAARAAGAPPLAVQNYIRALAPKVPMDAIGAGDRFAMVVEQSRAATGEVEYGKLLYVGLDRMTAAGYRPTRMIQWNVDGRTDWFDDAGVGRSRGGFTTPVAGARLSSGYGMRFHPLLGYTRMHQGVDYAAAYGTPIRAVSAGVVNFAGWHGGHGNMIKLAHANGLGSGYAHMSRIAVAPGARVAQGQIIGFVGSTGLSTGSHLHFEVYRGGVAVNPSSVSFQSTPLLSGAELVAFRARLNGFAGTTPQRPVQISSR